MFDEVPDRDDKRQYAEDVIERVRRKRIAGQSDQRILQVKAFRRATKNGTTEELFRELYTLSDTSVELLSTYGKLFELTAFRGL